MRLRCTTVERFAGAWSVQPLGVLGYRFTDPYRRELQVDCYRNSSSVITIQGNTGSRPTAA